MTYFTESVYEKMMVQKPIYGREKTSPAPNNKRRKKRDCSTNKKETISTHKERKKK
jgi:hypothetical protein